MKYPVRITYPNNNRVDFKLLTLEEANQKFVVVDGNLLEQEVKVLHHDTAVRMLKYSRQTIEECLEDITYCTGDVLERVKTRLREATADIEILKEVLEFYSK